MKKCYNRDVDLYLRKALAVMVERERHVKGDRKTLVYQANDRKVIVNVYKDERIQVDITMYDPSRMRIKAIWSNDLYQLEYAGTHLVMTGNGKVQAPLSDRELAYLIRKSMERTFGQKWVSKRTNRYRNVLAWRKTPEADVVY